MENRPLQSKFLNHNIQNNIKNTLDIKIYKTCKAIITNEGM